MSYSVSTCPRCGRRKVFQSPAKTTECPWCGKRHRPARSREYDTLDEARAAMAAAADGGVAPLDSIDSPTSAPANKRVKKMTAQEVADALTGEHGEFTEAQFAERARAERIAEPEEALKMLAEAGCVVEPRLGRYRSV